MGVVSIDLDTNRLDRFLATDYQGYLVTPYGTIIADGNLSENTEIRKLSDIDDLSESDIKGLGNTALYDSSVAQLTQANPQHPYLTGRWPDFPSNLRKLNPFVGESSPIDKIVDAPPPELKR